MNREMSARKNPKRQADMQGSKFSGAFKFDVTTGNAESSIPSTH
jgi:hypothetical protein